MRKSVLALGLDPQFADFTKFPNLTPEAHLVHVMAPTARLCFNTNPADSVEAVRRWV